MASSDPIRTGRVPRGVLLALLAAITAIGVVASVRTWRRDANSASSTHSSATMASSGDSAGDSGGDSTRGANGRQAHGGPAADGTLTVPVGVPMAGSPFLSRSDCAECHAEIVDTFVHSGHSTTFARSAESSWARKLDGQTFVDPERKTKFQYAWNPRGLFVSMPDVRPGSLFPLQFVVGSGKHGGVTFVSLLPNPTTGGVVGLEHRVSWHGPDSKLIVTPGHEGLAINNPLESLGRLIDQHNTERCFGCHVTEFVLQGTDAERLYANVECENCHGSAREHVARMRSEERNDGGSLSDSAGPASRIAFGRQGETARQQIERCGACHRLPSDVEPRVIFAGSKSIVRFQPIGILKSRCFTESGDSLRCTTCHNPHAPPEVRDRSTYEASCRKCHASGAGKTECSELAKKNGATGAGGASQSGCIDCHMPSIEVHAGMRFHDHWIRRVPAAAAEK